MSNDKMREQIEKILKDLEFWRAERPDEWTMDDIIIRPLKKLQAALEHKPELRPHDSSEGMRPYDEPEVSQNTKDYYESVFEDGARQIQKYKDENEELKEDLKFVERWANHHAIKPNVSAEEALSVIQHYPSISDITKSYFDGVLPDTRNPYVENEVLAHRIIELKDAIFLVCDGFNVSDDVRKILETAMWSKK